MTAIMTTPVIHLDPAIATRIANIGIVLDAKPKSTRGRKASPFTLELTELIRDPQWQHNVHVRLNKTFDNQKAYMSVVMSLKNQVAKMPNTSFNYVTQRVEVNGVLQYQLSFWTEELI